MMCDGASRDEVMFGVHAKVLRFGWALQVVGGDDDRADWIYTLGLSSGFAHPELVMVGGRVDDVAPTLNELGALVRRGHQLDTGDVVEASRGWVTFDDVHPVHIDDGLVAICDEYHEALGGPPQTQRVLQVVPLSGPLAEGEPVPMLLSDPMAELPRTGGPGPNRAARRARARAARRRHGPAR